MREQTDFFRHRFRGFDIVPRDHHHLYARAHHLGDRGGHLFADIVADTDERDEGEVFEILFSATSCPCHRHRQNAHRLLRHRALLAADLRRIESAKFPVLVHVIGTKGQDFFGRALDKRALSPKTGIAPCCERTAAAENL